MFRFRVSFNKFIEDNTYWNKNSRYFRENPEEAFVDITVYDMFGNTVKTLVDEKMSSGFKSVQWNAKDYIGQPVPTGLYLYTKYFIYL